MTGKSSGAGICTTPNVCHSTTSSSSTVSVPSPIHSGKPRDGSPLVCAHGFLTVRIEASHVADIPGARRGAVVIRDCLARCRQLRAAGEEGVSVVVFRATHWGVRRHRVNHEHRVLRSVYVGVDAETEKPCVSSSGSMAYVFRMPP
ncbi:hypothetical protein VTK73DRAFT_8253 [Phialemonium thermophilum]|uniref:Uncharacterized protein n=1 Tax=Phialemonium thermophilum TaxID=223376 RepID=A0ABR3XR29_9PEZI